MNLAERGWHWISNDIELAAAVSSWGSILALDTEFIRTDTFFPVPGLYQVASGDQVYLIDPLTIQDWSPFVAIMCDPDVVKVMHACQEDLELLHHHLALTPQSLFDTQFAHAFVSENYSLSYAGLVASRLGVTLDKHETRSDWLARPLSGKQVAYAVEDVIYLETLYTGLHAELLDTGKLDWFVEEMRGRGRYSAPQPQQYFKGLKKAWQLERNELAVLQSLCAWREAKAVSEDVPRNRVIWDEHLISFAQSARLELDDVYAAVPRGVAQRYSKELIAAHASGTQAFDLPERLARPLTSAQGKIVKSLREHGVEVAQRLNLAPELICRKKELEECVRHYLAAQALAPGFMNWRKDIVGDQYLALMMQHTGGGTK